MAIIKWVLRAIDSTNEWSGRIISFLINILMLIIVFDVCMRYFFNMPTIWAMDVSQFILLACICFGGGYTFLHHAHVTVGVVRDRLSVHFGALLDLITHVLLFLICAVLVWDGGKAMFYHLQAGNINASSSLQYPMWIIWILVPVAGVLLGFQALAKWIRDWIIVIKGVKIESEVYEGEGGIRG